MLRHTLTLTSLCREGRLKDALHILLTTHNPPEHSSTSFILLQTCISHKALSQGKKIHSHINHSEFQFTPHKLIQDTLIRMYGQCGCLVDARQVFDQMTERDVFSWNIMIAAYKTHGYPHEALTLFHQMQRTGVQPDQFTFASILPACAKIGALEQGMDIHESIMEKGLLSDVVVASALVDMYAKCRSMHKACEVFDKMPERNVVSWTAMIAGYAQNGFVEEALETFKQMKLVGVKLNSATFASILPACAKMGAIEQGMEIHQSIIEREFLPDVVVASALVDMYVKCGSMHKARELFDKMPKRNVVSWTAMIVGYTQNGLSEKALETFKQMQLAGVKPNSTTFASILPACARLGAIEQGMDIHHGVIEFGFSLDVIAASALIDMYAKCGSTHKAHELFDRMAQRNVISWNAMIAGYAQNGFVEKAVETFKQMQLSGVKPDCTTFVIILPACAKMGALEQGMDIHQSIIEGGFSSDVTVANALIDMYAKCGSAHEAHELFDKMTQRDVVSWNAMIVGYAHNRFVEKAVETFKQMQLSGINPNSTTFASILPACAKMGALEKGMDIHQSIIECGFSSDVIVVNALVDMYAKCGSTHKARELFDKIDKRDVVSWNTMIAGYAQNGVLDEALKLFKEMPQRDVVSWTAMITGYAQNGVLDEALRIFNEMPQRDVVSWNVMIAGYANNGFVQRALETFKQMQLAGVKPNSTTFASILAACAKMGGVKQGMNIHQSIIECGFFSDITVANALIDMYAKCGFTHMARELFNKMAQRSVVSWNAMIAGYAQNGILDEALRLFKEMPQRDVVSWNAMIAGYAQNGFTEMALEIFKQMQLAGVKPISTTFVSILPACAKMQALEQGMNIHQSIIESGFLSDVIALNALIDLYAKCGSTHKARELFDKMAQRDVVSWNAMIAGYARNGFVEKALETFKKMQLAGIKPNSTTFASILPACAKMGAIEQGMDIHQSIIEFGFLSDAIAMNALIDMYAKCGSTHKAFELFDKMAQRNVVSWNAMIAGYAQNGFVEKAVETFKQMQLSGVKPDSTTFASVLPACAKMGALEQGMDIHQSVIECGFSADVIVGNAMIDMYSKCGSTHKAHELFDKMAQRDIVSWNTMIAGYAQNGFCMDALKLFEVMKHSGPYPDHLSFSCVLLACSHAGLVDEGCKYFNGMSDFNYIIPTIDHYVCMIDLLGRAGYLEETLNYIIKMPIKPVVVVCTCLLGACRAHRNTGLGVFTANLLFEMDPQNVATYVLLSNIYAEVGRWGEVQLVRRMMKDRGIKKFPGCSWIEGHKMVHAFCVGDRSHP